MKIFVLLLPISALAFIPAVAQTTPAMPGIGPNYRTSTKAALSYQRPVEQTKVYQVGPGTNSYQTRPNALRVAVPDTLIERPMPRMALPSAAFNNQGVVPMPPQRRE